MKPVFRNILALLIGVIIGVVINLALIQASSLVIPPPDGADFTTEAGLKAGMHLMQPKHFLFPWLAHALGTFTGAYVAARIAVSHRLFLAIIVGAIFLVGGVQMLFMLPSPWWFNVADLLLAYLPMSWLGWRLATAHRLT
ncbi:MAG TPA: hypothetical protein PLP06_12675 [Saprospiraceae bacterium]|nr:hypothetical protein [Saprospiraceae bacterium]